MLTVVLPGIDEISVARYYEQIDIILEEGIKIMSFTVTIFVMHFIIKDKLRTEIKGELADLKKGNEIIFSLFVESKEEVNLWAKEMQKAGGKLVSNPEEFGEGDIMVLFSPTLTVISLMSFLCKFFGVDEKHEPLTSALPIVGPDAGIRIH